jgi:antitoxin component of MazEF toxin-antitoxin module
MTITTIQKVIKIGTSRGVTLPAKELERLGVKEGEEVEIIARKKTSIASSDKVQQVADSILSRYDQDFKNLAER